MKSILSSGRRRNAAPITLLVGFCTLQLILFRLSVESYVQLPSVSLHPSHSSQKSIISTIIPQTRNNDSGKIRIGCKQSIMLDGIIRGQKISFPLHRKSTFTLQASQHSGAEVEPLPGELSSQSETFDPSSSSQFQTQKIDNLRSTPETNCNRQNAVGSLSSRRAALASMTSASIATALLASSPARAGVSEIDKNGLLYTPKKVMLSGGSAAGRGIKIEQSTDNGLRAALKQGEKIQNVYDTRFVAYLSRFLINFDDAANTYWKDQTMGIEAGSPALDLKFAEFSESVEIGLADYFVGPYGSYASLNAMKAGISAKYQAKSKKYDEVVKSEEDSGFGSGILKKLANGIKSRQKGEEENIKKEEEQAARRRFAKQGILNLYTLLKARYRSKAAKYQIAILFSFILDPPCQPTNEIRSLLGEADDASVTKIEVQKVFVRDESISRTSCKRGGGYSVNDSPVIAIDVPPALGSAYKLAKAKADMKCTSRVLKINVIDGGSGYTKCPEVYVGAPGGAGSTRQAVAQAILGRQGQIEQILVLDPGYGYGRNKKETPPKVIIKAPEEVGIKDQNNSVKRRRAIAKAELEYEIASIQVTEEGNGFVATEPPKVYITPPDQEPDWFVDFTEFATTRQSFGASVVEMRGPKGNLAYSPNGYRPTLDVRYPLRRFREDPILLLPTVVRPEVDNLARYNIPRVTAIATNENVLDNPRFRAIDPLFGAIGALPAQKAATELKSDEYARLAAAGAICTVLVRTALNPLELIKTKLQLENDEDLLSYARQKLGPPDPHGDDNDSQELLELKPTAKQPKSMANLPSGTATQSDLPATPNPNTPVASLAINATTTSELDREFAGGLAVATPTATATNTDVAHIDEETKAAPAIGAKDLLVSLIDMRGFPAIFQSADITLLASIMFGSLGFGATELFRRLFTAAFFEGGSSQGLAGQLVLLTAATIATIITCAAASPFELLRVRSMGMVEPQEWITVMKGFLKEKMSDNDNKNALKSTNGKENDESEELDLKTLNWKDFLPLWAGFGPTTSRELAFAIPKFLAFDIIAKAITGLANSQLGEGALPIQVGVGGAGLAISAFSGACAGIAGAFVSHPADLILTKLSASSKSSPKENEAALATNETILEAETEEPNWKDIVGELLSKEGGIANLYAGLTPRLVFFFLVIGLQFFLYDYVKNLLEVGSDDLSLVLDIFYAVRQGLVEQPSGG